VSPESEGFRPIVETMDVIEKEHLLTIEQGVAQ
jgi:hypothetical protein